MGLFSKFKDLINRKKKVASQIESLNEAKVQVDQSKFDQGLKKSTSLLQQSIDEIAKKYRRLDDDLIQAIEEALISFDIGVKPAQKILDAIVEEIKFQNVTDPNLIKQIIVDKIFVYYIQDTVVDTDLKLLPLQPNVILVSGVNGVGKTTSIAKLAYLLKNQNHKVCLVAADTFRAGAIEQLSIWAQRLELPIVKPDKPNQDPVSVIYTGLEYAKQNQINVLICDTSGRLQNKVNLMNELKKMDKVIKRFHPDQPVESLLVLDATTGQSGLMQAKIFNEVTHLTGIILTKMDSTSKGGIILAIKDIFNLPVKYIGLGENLTDLATFDLEMFVHGMLDGLNIDTN